MMIEELEFTDDEIIKAVECCKDKYGGDCERCPFTGEDCVYLFPDQVHSLINRQKAEIERLQKLLDDKCDRCIEKNRAELARVEAGRREDAEAILSLNRELLSVRKKAVEEFAEKLKALKIKPEFPWDDFFVTEGAIDDLVKEFEKG